MIAFALLELQRHGFRRFELAITAFLGLILLGFLYETLKVGPSGGDAVQGLVPHLDGTASVYLAVGIIGATVMPHVIYLHSALMKGRTPGAERGRAETRARFESTDVIVALGLAGIVEHGDAHRRGGALPRHRPGWSHVDTLQGAHAGFSHLVGGTAALAFAVALFASGASSSSVGTYAGQVVMAGFVDLRISLIARRALTMIPALVVLAIGVSPTSALVLSQVVLSFGIPFALVPLLLLTRRKDVMGAHVNRLLDHRRRRRDRRADQRAQRLPARAGRSGSASVASTCSIAWSSSSRAPAAFARARVAASRLAVSVAQQPWARSSSGPGLTIPLAS